MKLSNWSWPKSAIGPLCRVPNLFVGPGVHGLNLIVWVNIHEVTKSGSVRLMENPPETISSSEELEALKSADGWKICSVQELDPAIGVSLRGYLTGCGY